MDTEEASLDDSTSAARIIGDSIPVRASSIESYQRNVLISLEEKVSANANKIDAIAKDVKEVLNLFQLLVENMTAVNSTTLLGALVAMPSKYCDTRSALEYICIRIINMILNLH